MSAILGTVTGLCTYCSSPSTLYNVAEYLMLVYRVCLNSLLTMDSIPSTSYHLLWIWSLESIECLETCSHQWQVISPLIFLGIHQCPLIDGFFKCSNSTPLFVLFECTQYIDTHFHHRWVALHLLMGYLNDQ